MLKCLSDFFPFGCHGRILDVDLTSGRIEEKPLDPGLVYEYLGGRGLAARIFYDAVDPACDPLGPDNVLVIAASPIVGTNAPTAGRGHMVFKSPLTGVIGSSNSGGAWGAAFKAAGYDALIIRGSAKDPAILDIKPGRAELFSAASLWGKSVPETTEALSAGAEAGHPFRVLCIGPAGERLVRIASVANENNRVYGRCGPGAVFGSKKLKAVRVSGKVKIEIKDKELFSSGLDQAHYLLKQAPVTKRLLRELGTAGLVGLINLIHMLPHRNFQDCRHLDENVEKILGETLAMTYLVKAGGCFLCPIGCQRHTAVPGRAGDKEKKGEGPEYETIALMGPLCDIYDLEAIVRANYLCNELGLDTMSFGGTLACAMELFENGRLTPEDTGGLDLSFGNAAVLKEMVRMTAFREGIGDRLAEGSFRLAASCGRGEYSMSVKKLEIPGYDPRASFTQALGYMTSPSGACHLRGGYAVSLAFFGGTKEIPRFSLLQSPLSIRNTQNLGILQDSLGVCRFTGYAFSTEPWARMVSGTTGRDFSVSRLEEIANRVAALERLFNFEAGLRAEDDDLPARFSEIPVMIEGKERRLSRDDKNRMLKDYYEIRRWESDGRPSESLLNALNVRRRPRR